MYYCRKIWKKREKELQHFIKQAENQSVCTLLPPKYLASYCPGLRGSCRMQLAFQTKIHNKATAGLQLICTIVQSPSWRSDEEQDVFLKPRSYEHGPVVKSYVTNVDQLSMKRAEAQHPDHSRHLISLLQYCWSNVWCFNSESLLLSGERKARGQSHEFKPKVLVQ